MKITGTARNFDVSQPSIARTFFGGTVYHFVLITDDEIGLPTGALPKCLFVLRLP